MVKSLPPNAGRCKRRGFDPKVGKTPWGEEMATHSSVLAERIPWTEQPGWQRSMGLQSQTRLSDLALPLEY